MKRMLTRKPFSKMTGLTLLETMFALAVGALVLIGAVIFYMSTKTSATTGKAVTDMNGITAAADTYLSSGKSVDDLNGKSGIGSKITGGNKTGAVGTLQAAGLLPDPMNNPFGNEYSATATGNKLTITITGLPVAAQGCTNITSSVKNSQGVTAADTSGTDCAFDYTL